ncbi:hypothetical protein HMPREF3291_01350 [Bacillus sp. HMSC76G11]|nr:hypothetical protein HMPREF3291_01350 [Bacillus sp. HMSC76G11]
MNKDQILINHNYIYGNFSFEDNTSNLRHNKMVRPLKKMGLNRTNLHFFMKLQGFFRSGIKNEKCRMVKAVRMKPLEDQGVFVMVMGIIYFN